MKVAVWHPAAPGNPSADETDSQVQARSVASALAELGADVELIALEIGDLGASVGRLIDRRPDLVFNLVEETAGVQQLNVLPAQLLAVAGLPFTGSGGEALALTGHKLAAKALMRTSGLPTPDWLTAEGDEPADDPELYLVKPVSTDASQGIDERHLELGRGARGARAALRKLGAGRGRWFAERYVEGREFNLSLLELDGRGVVLPPAEMLFIDYPPSKLRVVGYRAKWDPDSFEYRHTARRFDLSFADSALTERLRELATRCWDLFELRGYARVDFRVDDRGRPWILEVNANPCLAPDAGLAAAAAQTGLAYRQLVGAIVEAALRVPVDARVALG